MKAIFKLTRHLATEDTAFVVTMGLAAYVVCYVIGSIILN